MKKQFSKVKQFADQKFSRTGKTEVLSDTLQKADRRVEFITDTCQDISKQLLASLISPELGHDASARNKRLKKKPEYLLAMAMINNVPIEEDNLMRQVLVESSKVQTYLASVGIDYELRIEQTVLDKLQQVIDVDIPNISKHKRILSKLGIDLTVAKTKYVTALKSSVNAHTNKIDVLKEELDGIELKVEQCKDNLTSEIFQFISRESEFSSTFLKILKHQRSYHQAALTVLDEIVPELETLIECSPANPVFGQKLEDHLRITERRIAYPIELCICTLLEIGVKEEGLFRIAASASKIRSMKHRLDSNCLDLESAVEYKDPHIIAGVLKSYLRELPEPILTHHLYEEWMAAAKLKTSESRLEAILNVVQKLPQTNLYNLRYIIKFLALLTKHQDINKMSPQNLSIVFAPNLLWTLKDNNDNLGLNVNAAVYHNIIVDCLISHSDWIFPGEEEFYITLNVLEINEFNGIKRSNNGDTHLIPTNVDIDISLKRSRSNSSTNIIDMSLSSESTKPHSRGRKNKSAPVPTSRTIKTNNIYESPISSLKDQDNINCDEILPGSLLKPCQYNESPKQNLPAADTGSLKRTVKPAVAPRTILETSNEKVFYKPAIPNKPAFLQRSLNSSFRSLQILSDVLIDKPDVDTEGPILKTSELYTLSKQEISSIKVGDECDNKETRQNQYNVIMDSCTNQESLNDNNNVHKSPNIFSRCHTLSKIQTGQSPILKTLMKTQRPIPPPPPPPVCSTKKQPEKSD